MYNEVEVKAILIAVHNIENVGLNSKKVLLNSIEWLRCQYEITQDESFLIKAVWHIYAYLELGYPYISGELEFNRILNCLQLDINTVFPKKGWAYKKVALKKSNINQILGRWHPHFQSMKIEAAILDIIDKVENKKIGSFIYHCGKMLEQKDNKALWEKTFVLRVTEDEAVLQDVNKSKCCGIIVITGALLCAVLFKYQLWLDEMANGSKPIRGINASMNLSAISLLIVLSGMFIIKYQVVKQEKTTLILRDQLLEERYAEMLKSRQMIHDMKNHLLVLRNMERANQWDKLHDYLEEISKDILDDSTKIWTGNNIVDLILNSKKKQADSEGIAFSIGSNMIGDVPFKDGETISLLGNLLDNAIEACERIKSTEKWVTIRINRRYCLLYIEIENSIEEHPKEKNHRLISCKSEKEVHGYGLGYAGMRKKEREKIAYELLTEFGIDDLEKKHVSQMSGGEQQRIAIMRAIINKPQILLADEPTGNLDKENSQTIMNLFERLNKQGMTIVMVTHDTSLAKYGTRVVRVEDGRIIEKGKEILK